MEKEKLLLILSAVLAVLVLINAVALGNLYFGNISDLKQQEELAKPAKIELTLITAQDCKECFDIQKETASLNSLYEVTKTSTFDISSEQGKALAQKYLIQRLPSFIIEGEISKVSQQGLRKSGDVLVFDAAKMPYQDIEGNVKGVISAKVVLKKSCDKCFDISLVLGSMENAGMFFSSVVEIDSDSNEGKALINKYGIKRLPFAVFDSGLSEYPDLAQSWEAFGSVQDGNYVFSEVDAPYYNISSSRVEGLVALTLLDDESCTECYDVGLHRQILDNMGIVLDPVKTIDISSDEGKFLLKKYSITKVPTIIMSKDAAHYPVLVQTWLEVGTIEQDGSFVFRGFDVWTGQTYKDLEDGLVK